MLLKFELCLIDTWMIRLRKVLVRNATKDADLLEFEVKEDIYMSDT